MDCGDTLITACIGLFLYFLPSVVGHWRRHPNRLAIVMLNLLLGWTELGWYAALGWACMATRDREEA